METPVEVDGVNVKETKVSVLYSDDAGMEIWIPKSTMKEWPEEGEEGLFVMSEWIAIEKGIV